ncbi:MAG: hypothetical protein WBD56_17075 [Anaerolineales bacterium]
MHAYSKRAEWELASKERMLKRLASKERWPTENVGQKRTLLAVKNTGHARNACFGMQGTHASACKERMLNAASQ